MMIAQVHEQQVAMVALAVNPARQADLPPHVGGAQFGAMVRAIRMHSAARFRQLFVLPRCTRAMPLCQGGQDWFISPQFTFSRRSPKPQTLKHTFPPFPPA